MFNFIVFNKCIVEEVNLLFPNMRNWTKGGRCNKKVIVVIKGVRCKKGFVLIGTRPSVSNRLLGG